MQASQSTVQRRDEAAARDWVAWFDELTDAQRSDLRARLLTASYDEVKSDAELRNYFFFHTDDVVAEMPPGSERLAELHSVVQRLRGSVGQIDNPARNHRTTVIHAHDHGLAVAQVGHLDIAPHGKRQVGGGHVVHLIGLPAGGGFTFKGLPIPGRGPNLIRLRLDLFADFWSNLNRTHWSRFRLRDVRSLSRSQPEDQANNRQSLSYTSLHSVLLAYSKVTLALRLFPAVLRCYRRAKGVSRRKAAVFDDLLRGRLVHELQDALAAELAVADGRIAAVGSGREVLAREDEGEQGAIAEPAQFHLQGFHLLRRQGALAKEAHEAVQDEGAGEEERQAEPAQADQARQVVERAVLPHRGDHSERDRPGDGDEPPAFRRGADQRSSPSSRPVRSLNASR